MTARRRHTSELPKFWRPKLDASQDIDARVIHWDLVSRFTAGTASMDDVWDWMETGFTYSQMMRLLAEDGVEFTTVAQQAIAAQLDAYQAVAARFRRTGRAGFTGPELQIARAAAEVFDALLQLDRHGIAARAARWSTQQMASIRRRAA